VQLLFKVSEESFNNLKIPIIFNDNNTSRCFGVIRKDEREFGLAWQSDLIEPEVKEIDSSIYGIGIDQLFAIVDFKKNLVLLRLGLTYNFFTTQIFKDSILVITELEIIRLERIGFEISKRYSLPDYFEKAIFRDGILEIKCMGETSIEIGDI
jgi:hypothetical protein